jgi:uncharacterized membrane protein
MIGGMLFSVLLIILVMMVVMTYYLNALRSNKEDVDHTEVEAQRIANSQNYIYAGLVLVITLLLIVLYISLKGTIWEAHMMEWLNIIVRLMHITFGIAWIGASFYFVFLENALNRTRDVRDELAGNLWAVHGGGFYYLEKYKVAPKTIPKHLHWFKYEAYFTWLSGFCLLFVVYYFNASAMLIDKNVMDMGAGTGIAIGIGSFLVAWIIYDLLCKSPLKKNKVLFTLLSFAICVCFAYFYSKVFNNRAAYIHFGAMLGSIMVANVFFVIIPSQKAMVKAGKEGKPLDPQLGKNALFRSLHNNYLTLPVLFVMISNHFPSTFGNEYQWVVLSVITLGTAGVKHYLNLREKGQLSVWVMPASVIILLGAAFMTAPSKPGACTSEVSIAEVNTIFQQRCVSCHSSKPTDELYTAPPNGIIYDTPADIAKLKDKIMQRVVVTKTMPQNNKTNMTEKERDIVRCWIEQGASLK